MGANCERTRDLTRVIYGQGSQSGDRFAIAGLARAVAEVAAAGDETAKTLLTAAGKELAGQVGAAGRGIGFSAGEAFEVVAAGGVLSNNPVVFGALHGGVLQEYPQARIGRAGVPPAVGASGPRMSPAYCLSRRSERGKIYQAGRFW